MKKLALNCSLIVVLCGLFTACPGPFFGAPQETGVGTFTVTISGGVSRASLPWDLSTPLTDLNHIIRIIDSRGAESARQDNVASGSRAQFSVTPGNYVIEVQAHNSGGVLKAEGSISKIIEAGANGTINVPMGPPITGLQSIVIDQYPTRTNYHIGDSFDPAGLIVHANYTSVVLEIPHSFLDISYNFSSAGAQQVTISFGGEEVILTVTVSNISLTGISIANNPTKMIYNAGESFDPAGLAVQANYSDSSSLPIPLSFLTFDYDFSLPGQRRVTISHGHPPVIVEFTVTVNARPHRLVAGGWHSAFIRDNRTMLTWGLNSSRQLGRGGAANTPLPTIGNNWAFLTASLTSTLAITTDGRLFGWGGNQSFQIGPGATQINDPREFGNAGAVYISVSIGTNHTMAVTTGGRIHSWGNQNTQGQHGDATVTDATDWLDVAAGLQHTIALKTDGTLWAWGRNDRGQLGRGTTSGANTSNPSAVRIGTANDWAFIAAGPHHNLAIKTDGSLWAWGENHFGQLGDNTRTNRTTPVRIGNTYDWAFVSAGGLTLDTANNNMRYTVGMRTDGSLWIWGRGPGAAAYTSNIPVRVVLSDPGEMIHDARVSIVSAGSEHVLAFDTHNNLWAWGVNGSGQLGDGTATNRPNPIRITLP